VCLSINYAGKIGGMPVKQKINTAAPVEDVGEQAAVESGYGQVEARKNFGGSK
jgi:hypothetical protein